MANDMDTKGIDILPYREPFLYLDWLISYSKDGSVGQVTFGAERDFFRGHFPSHPIVPGVILLEAMCQSAAAGVLACRRDQNGKAAREILLFAGADNVRFHRPVHPGETFVTQATVLRLGHGIGKFHVRGSVDGVLSAEVIEDELVTTPVEIGKVKHLAQPATVPIELLAPCVENRTNLRIIDAVLKAVDDFHRPRQLACRVRTVRHANVKIRTREPQHFDERRLSPRPAVESISVTAKPCRSNEST